MRKEQTAAAKEILRRDGALPHPVYKKPMHVVTQDYPEHLRDAMHNAWLALSDTEKAEAMALELDFLQGESLAKARDLRDLVVSGY